MKRFAVSILILLTVSLCLMSAFAATAGRLTNSLQGPNQPAGIVDKATEIGEKIIGAKPKAPVNPIADPNKVRATVRKYEGLEEELKDIDKESADEIREWLDNDAEDQTALAREVHEQVRAELMLIRKLAVEEGADKTTAAIDGILLNRQMRFDKLNEKLQEEKSELRQTRTTRSRRTPRQRGTQERRVRERNP